MNLIRLPISNPSEMLNAGAFGAGALIRLQSGTAQAGPFSNLATAALVASQYSYLLFDQSGAVTTWYRWRLENAGGSVTGTYSTPFELSSSVPYAGVPDLRRRLGKAETDTGDDDLLLAYANMVTDRITNYCGRLFGPSPGDGSTAQFLFDGWDLVDGGPVTDNGKTLLVPRGIVSLTTVEIATFTGDTFVALPSADWFLRPTLQELTPGWPFTEVHITNIPSGTDTRPAFYPGLGTTRLTGILDWPSCPPAVNDIALTVSVASYRARGAGGGDRYQIDADGVRTFERMWSLTDKRALDKLKLIDPSARII